jgi:WD40 repeat protein
MNGPEQRRSDRTATVALRRPRADDATPAAVRIASAETVASTRRTASRDPASVRPLPPLAAIKHYEIIRPLGQGGMGQVYLARDTKLGRLVAIKRLFGQDDARNAHLLLEAQATARCKHENIVVVYEVGEHEGEPYLVLEYVEGSTLRTLMRRRATSSEPGAPRARLGLAAALDLVVPVVRALVCAHEQGVVHRDLKPENVLLTADGRVKVVDFGIAVRLGAEVTPAAATEAPTEDPSSTERERVQGTYLYMAPEQWMGGEIDHRIDLWAVGLLLYELCAGVHPLASLEPGGLASVADLESPMPSILTVCSEAGALASVVDRCLNKRREGRFDSARELLDALESLRAGRPALAEGASPFPGLSAFQEADAGRFFGRDADVAAALQMLRARPLLAVIGSSGAGKSSFVRAGIIPALKRSGERWESFVVRPGRRPLAALAEVLALASERPNPSGASGIRVIDMATGLRQQPGQLGVQLRARCREQGARLLLFVDQFEELYTLGVEPGERASFLACLEGVADDASSPLRVALAVRTDFFDRLAEQRGLAAEVARGLVVLAPLGQSGLRDALVRPVEDAGHRFDSDALVDQMVAALAESRSPLPLLQFAGAKMWDAREREARLLTEESYRLLGGFSGALAAHADAVFDGLPATEQRVCRAVLLRLVTPERTRAVVDVEELRGLDAGKGGGEPGGESAEIEAVVRKLVDARLLSEETGGDGKTLELVHESLIEAWPRLGRWLDEGAHDAEFLARLRAAAKQWQAAGEVEGLLWRDDAAAEARAWLEHRRAERDGMAGVGAREERFLRAVASLSERARRRRRWAITGVIAALAAFSALGSFLAVRARDGEALARAEAVKARNAARIAAAREKQADPTTVLSIVRELEPPDLPHGWAALADGALRGSVARVVLTLPEEAWAVAWSPDGRRFAAGSADGAVRIFRADGTGEPLVLRGGGSAANAVGWSPDGRRIATAWDDGTVRVFATDENREPLVLRGHEDSAASAEFSPDGQQIASASVDGTVRVWRADGSGTPVILRGHEDDVLAAAWRPDGHCIASSSVDKTIRIWNADGTGEPTILRGHKRAVTWLAWSPDGQSIASSSFEGVILIWHVDGNGEPTTLRGHEAGINSVGWSRDGRRIVSAANDRTARVFRVDGSAPPLVLSGHEGAVLAAAFSPDGESVLTSSTDRTVRIYSADGAWEPFALRGHTDVVTGVAFSPDGRRVASISMDGTARVWTSDHPREPVVLRGHEDFLISLAFSPDGQQLATASTDDTARVWNADGSGRPVVLRGHTDDVLDVAFSPAGRHIATASSDKTVRIWSTAGTGQPRIVRGHDSRVTAVAYSPDGRLLVTGSADNTARIWDVDSGAERAILRGHGDALMSAAFSPDGRRVATVSSDKTARIWSADGEALHVLRGHHHRVSGVSWSPDGEILATGSTDQTVRLWRTDGAGEPLVLRGKGLVSDVAFSPDGKRLAGAVGGEVWIWTDLEPPSSVDAPALWNATTYCLPAERRVDLLNVSRARAIADERACRARVDAH